MNVSPFAASAPVTTDAVVIPLPLPRGTVPPAEHTVEADGVRLVVRTGGPDHCRVAMSGELDVAGASPVREVLRKAVEAHARVDLDVSELLFCDCSGLGALLTVARAAQEYGCDFRLHAVPRHLVRLLRLSRTAAAFTVGDCDLPTAERVLPVPGQARVTPLRVITNG